MPKKVYRDLPNPAQYLLEEARKRRRRHAQAIERGDLWAAISTGFTVSADRYTQGVGLDILQPNIKTSVAQLLKSTGVTAENMREKMPRERWREHLDPMYNGLRFFISKSKQQSNAAQVTAFWNSVAGELLSQLTEIAATAELPVLALGDAKYITEDELKK